MLLQPYNPLWSVQFQAIKAEIEKVLDPTCFPIEHVGSTAVPFLDAKPIIDIDIIFHNPSDFIQIKTGLQQLGYYHNGNQGIQGRDVFKRSGLNYQNVLDTIPHHLYVCLSSCPALERHLLLRDHLRKNDNARLQYQSLKYEMAHLAYQDRKHYQELKELHINGFIDAIIHLEKNNGPSPRSTNSN